MSGGFIRKWSEDFIRLETVRSKNVDNSGDGSSAGSKKSEAQQNRPLKLDDLQGAFIILAIGHMLSLITLLGERTYSNRVIGRCTQTITP
jgi:hypothetical protein